MLLLGLPAQPHRGLVSLWANNLALAVSIIVFIFLTAYVLDATRLCKRFVDVLAGSSTKWPGPLLIKWAAKLKIDQQYLDEWLDIRFIAKISEVVGRLIWYPFLVLFLLIVSRNPYFDNFDWPLSLWLIFGLNSAFVMCSAILLRRAAKRAREKELERLHVKLIAAQRETANGSRAKSSYS